VSLNRLTEFRFVITGRSEQIYWYVAMIPGNMIDKHPDLTASSATSSLVDPSGILTDFAFSNLISGLDSMTQIANLSQLPLAFAIDPSFSMPSVISYSMLAHYKASLYSNKHYEVLLALTCSLDSPPTAISYSMGSYQGKAPPARVSLDGSTGTLVFTTPTVGAATQFKFAVLALVSGDTSYVVKPIYLSVNTSTD